ncbi:Wzz/FepE/Etk N-terminal domain-containing protein [Testudinibacter sp. P80/BLE/0925]|uniref:Wzz/FepE/Etk N-terminal domain-containing protein n=1 Tax=Testudinibacter sp. TW-1 TaxID=3417757 RepID=UPI003D35E6F2
MSETLPKAAPQPQLIEHLDLLAFAKILLRKSWLILLLMAVASAVAYVVTQFAIKPSWRAEAYVEAPKESELGNYYALYNMYQLVDAKGGVGNAGETVQSAVENSLTQGIYQQFKQQVKAYDVLKNFWLNSDYYKQMMNGDRAHDEALLESLIAGIHFTEGNARNNSNDKIELTLDNPKQAAELLNAFIRYANLSTRQMEYGNLIAKWKNLFDRITLAADNQLGQDQQGQLVPASVWQSKLAMMTSVQPLDNQFNAFHYLKTPVQPLAPYSPNPVLWMLSAAFAALLFGCAFAVILALRDFSRRQAHLQPGAEKEHG